MNDPTPLPAPPAPSDTPTLWQIYKSRFLYTQLFIALACIAIHLYRRNLALTISVGLFLQLAAVYGSWMGKRMLDTLSARNREE